MATDELATERARPERPRVVILGAGFGGLRAARGLASAPVDVTVVDRRNHHLFQPLLYQVASAALNPSDIAYPIRRALRHQDNARVLLADARAIDAARRRVVLADGELAYDYLIIATGVTHSYFGHPEWAEHAPGLKSLEDALEIRRRVLLAFEAAEREADPVERAAWLTFVIVGAGPTGVELAGALSEIARHTLRGDFRSIDPAEARVVLVEAGERVLPLYPEASSAEARAQLEALGVEVKTGAPVTGVDGESVALGDEVIRARTALWAAGVAASPLAGSLGVGRDRAGRVVVEPDLSIPGHREVFVVGDLAAVSDPRGRPVPGVAPAAIQGGRHAARAIRADVAGRARAPFHYRDKGSLATIGRARAVAALGRLRFAGFPAWLLWMAIHIAFLIGFRSRVFVMLQWAWSWLTFQRGARLITGEPDKLLPPAADRAARASRRRAS
jgi:NADH dehydrogenase